MYKDNRRKDNDPLLETADLAAQQFGQGQGPGFYNPPSRGGGFNQYVQSISDNMQAQQPPQQNAGAPPLSMPNRGPYVSAPEQSRVDPEISGAWQRGEAPQPQPLFQGFTPAVSGMTNQSVAAAYPNAAPANTVGGGAIPDSETDAILSRVASPPQQPVNEFGQPAVPDSAIREMNQDQGAVKWIRMGGDGEYQFLRDANTGQVHLTNQPVEGAIRDATAFERETMGSLNGGNVENMDSFYDTGGRMAPSGAGPLPNVSSEGQGRGNNDLPFEQYSTSTGDWAQDIWNGIRNRANANRYKDFMSAQKDQAAINNYNAETQAVLNNEPEQDWKIGGSADTGLYAIDSTSGQLRMLSDPQREPYEMDNTVMGNYTKMVIGDYLTPANQKLNEMFGGEIQAMNGQQIQESLPAIRAGLNEEQRQDFDLDLYLGSTAARQLESQGINPTASEILRRKKVLRRQYDLANYAKLNPQSEQDVAAMANELVVQSPEERNEVYSDMIEAGNTDFVQALNSYMKDAKLTPAN